MKNPVGNGLDKVYVGFTRPPLKSLDRVKARVGGLSGWRVVELAAGHDAMVTAPDELSALLMKDIVKFADIKPN